jgi:hypothetical protein
VSSRSWRGDALGLGGRSWKSPGGGATPAYLGVPARYGPAIDAPPSLATIRRQFGMDGLATCSILATALESRIGDLKRPCRGMFTKPAVVISQATSRRSTRGFRRIPEII